MGQQPKKRKPMKPLAALPFNLRIAQARRGLLQNKQNYLQNYRRQSADLRHENQAGMRALDVAQPIINRNILNNFSGRGMAYSSGYGTTLGDAANQYSSQRSNLQSNLATTLARMRADRTQAMNEFQYRLGNLNQQQVSASEGQAANFGRAPRMGKPRKKKRARRVM